LTRENKRKTLLTLDSVIFDINEAEEVAATISYLILYI